MNIDRFVKITINDKMDDKRFELLMKKKVKDMTRKERDELLIELKAIWLSKW